MGNPTLSSDNRSSLILRKNETEIATSRSPDEPPEANRLRVAQACVPCREKKAKCDGRRPKCSTCQRLNRACAYTGSKRDKQRLQLQNLQRKAHIYETLLGEVIPQVALHENVSIENILKKHFQQSPEIYADLLTSGDLTKDHIPMPSSRISLGHIFVESTSEDAKKLRPILKESPVQVKSIEFWTKLVPNDTASHLLSFYFTWENPTWNLIDQNTFLRDLENHGGGSCSRLLVHVLLFFGISFSYRLNQITDRREEKVLGQKLYDAIQPLWENDKSNQNLPTIQSGILLGLLSCTFGLDRLGTQFIMNGARSYSQQGLHIPAHEKCDSRDLSPSELSQEMVSWAIFDVHALASQVYRKESPWPTPPPLRCSPEQAERLDQDGEWTPYPFESPASRPYYYTTLQFRSALASIVNKLASFSLQIGELPMSSQDQDYCHQLFQTLVRWKASLPRSVMPEYNTTPHVLCLHFYYQATLISLGTLATTKSTPALDSDKRVEEVDFEAVKDEAMESIGSLILLFKHRHAWKSIPIVMLHYFCLGGVHATSRLSATDLKWTLVLESCVVGLWHMSLGWGRLCRAFLRTIELVLKSNAPEPSLIPTKVDAIFKHLNTDLWSAEDVGSLSADYVVQRISKRVDPSAVNGQTLEALIRAMENL